MLRRLRELDHDMYVEEALVRHQIRSSSIMVHCPASPSRQLHILTPLSGEGWLYIDGFYANKFGKFYRSCGNCSQQFQRHVDVKNLVAIQGVIFGVNENYGDTATLSNYCIAKVGVVCTIYNGCVKPCEAGEVSEGAKPPTCVVNGQDWS